MGGGFWGVFVVYERVAERDEVFVGGERVFKASPFPVYASASASASALSAPFFVGERGQNSCPPLEGLGCTLWISGMRLASGEYLCGLDELRTSFKNFTLEKNDFIKP